MLDDLRSSATYQDDDEETPPEPGIKPRKPRRTPGSGAEFLGMTAPQRFILALMLFMMVCVLGAFALVISGAVVLPFI